MMRTGILVALTLLAAPALAQQTTFGGGQATGGVTDHGGLTGLGDDDHSTVYCNLGGCTMTGAILGADGDLTNPMFSFASNDDMGMTLGTTNLFLQNQAVGTATGRAYLRLGTETFTLQTYEGTDANKRVFFEARDSSGMEFVQQIYSAANTYTGWLQKPQSIEWKFNTAGGGEKDIFQLGTGGITLCDQADDTKCINLVMSGITTSNTRNVTFPDSNVTVGAGSVDTSGTPVDDDFAKFTDADTIEGRSYAETRTDLGLVIGTDVLAEQTIGIADDNLLEVDLADAADDEYARFTANGIESRSVAEVLSDTGAITASSADTLTNKTIDGDDNTVQDLGIAVLKDSTDGELITWDAAGAPAAVAVGTAGHVLTSGGAGVAPTFQASGGGDVLSVGDCADGACLDGSADGGEYIRIYDGDSHYAEINPADLAANRAIVIPDAAGTILFTAGQGIAADTDGSGTMAARTITAGTGISMANGDGAAGNPTVSADTAVLVQFTSGAATPVAACSPGEIYHETDINLLWGCNSTNTWTANLTAASTHTVTNKTIDGDDNTVQDLGIAVLKDATDGELITWDAAGAPAAVAVGTAGHVLTSGGAGVAPTFQAGGAGTVDTSGVPVDDDFAKFTDADTIEGRSYAETRTDLGLVIGTNVLAEQTIGIADDNLMEVDDADAANTDYARFTANGLQGRDATEAKTDLGLVIGTNVLAEQTIGIADDNLMEVDDADAASTDYARFTANGLQGRDATEVKTDLGLVIGTDVLAEQTIGIADDNLLEVDLADAADDEYARFTANGIESRSVAEVLSDIGAITTSSADTLTNKTIDGDDNTVQDLGVAVLKDGTDGQLITWAADASATVVATGTADQVLTSNGAGAAPTFQAAAGGGFWTYVMKETDETIQEDTTMSADSELTFSVSANVDYIVEMMVIFETGGTGDFKFSWQCPASPDDVRGLYAEVQGLAQGINDVYTSNRDICSWDEQVAGGAGIGMIRHWVMFENGSNAGSLTFEWAQNASEAVDTTVSQGSYLRYKVIP